MNEWMNHRSGKRKTNNERLTLAAGWFRLNGSYESRETIKFVWFIVGFKVTFVNESQSWHLKSLKCTLPDLFYNSAGLIQLLFVVMLYAVFCCYGYSSVLDLFFCRPPAIQFHLRPDGRHAVWGVLAGWPVLLGAAAAAAGHRVRGPGPRRPDPPLQSEAPQTGRPVIERADRRKEGPVTSLRERVCLLLSPLWLVMQLFVRRLLFIFNRATWRWRAFITLRPAQCLFGKVFCVDRCLRFCATA